MTNEPIKNQDTGDTLAYEVPEAWKPRQAFPKELEERLTQKPKAKEEISAPPPVPPEQEDDHADEPAPAVPQELQEEITQEPIENEPIEQEGDLNQPEPTMETSEEQDAPTRAGHKISAFFTRLRNSQYFYLLFAFLIPTAIMYLMYAFKGIHPFANESVLVLDLNGQYVYFYEALRNAVLGDKSLLYSFSRALGGEFLGIYAYYIASPFAYLVCLFPKTRILEALLVIFLLKTGLSGLTFGWYLHKTSETVNKYTVWMFSCLYALCSYAIVQQHNSMWIDAFIWLPLVTYGIEQLIQNRKYKMFAITLALTIMSNFYIGYMVCIYVALYFFYYYLAHGGVNGDHNPRGEKCHFLQSLLRMGIFSAIAVGIAAVIILAAYYSLGFGKSTFSDPNWEFTLRYELADLFVKLLPGTYDTVRPTGLPFIYCGVLTLLMLPFYYLSKKSSIRQKLFATLFVAVFVLSFMINPVDIVWHGFQKPNWLNYRYSFMLSFFLLTLAYKGFVELRRHSPKLLFGVGATLALLVMILQKFEYPNFVIDDEYGFVGGKIDALRTVLFSIFMIVVLCAVLYLLIRAGNEKERRNLSLVLLIVVGVELFGNGLIHMSSLDCDVVYSTYSSYNDYISRVRPIAEEVMESDPSFYRMEKTTHRKTNDAMALGLRGLSCSTSTLNRETIRFLYQMGYGSESHWSRYLGGNPLSDSLLGIKYVLHDKKISETSSVYYETAALKQALELVGEVYTENDEYTAYKNPYALSIAYGVADALLDFQFEETDDAENTKALYLSPFERLNALVTAMTGAEETIEVFVPIQTASSYSNGEKYTIAGHTRYTPREDSAYDTYALFNAKMPTDALLYFYAPSEYQREVDFEVNGNDFEDFMASDSDRIKALGYYTVGTNVEAKLILTGETLYLKNNEFYFYYFDVDAFKQVMEILSREQLVLQEADDTHFVGNVTTADSSTVMLTTIAYDEGWKVKVDGEAVPIEKTLDALVSFKIEGAGTHRVEMVYSPDIVRLGCFISIGSLAVFGLIVGGEFLIKRRKTNIQTQTFEERN